MQVNTSQQSNGNLIIIYMCVWVVNKVNKCKYRLWSIDRLNSFRDKQIVKIDIDSCANKDDRIE